MKIGIVTEYFYPTLGGITENIYHFSKNLLELGHDFRIITGKRNPPTDIDLEIKERIIYVGKSMPVFFNGSCGRATVGTNLTKKVKKILKTQNFDLMHLHSPLFPTLPAIANMQSEVPTVGTFHTCTNDNNLLYRTYHGTCQKLLNRMSGRIAVSECCAAENQKYFDASFHIIPNGVDVNWWSDGTSKIKKFDDDKINILFLGRPDTRNGLDTLISAFGRVHCQYSNTRLIIVGDGPLKFYFKNFVPHAIKNAVHFEGAAGASRPDYLATAHIFCFTPTIASFGVTILEGMSAGQAIIASDIEAFRALVKNGESALLVPPKDEDALVLAIKRLIEDQALRKKLAATALTHVMQYDWKCVTQMHLDYYHQILAI